jgi:hypothetical protein
MTEAERDVRRAAAERLRGVVDRISRERDDPAGDAERSRRRTIVQAANPREFRLRRF